MQSNLKCNSFVLGLSLHGGHLRLQTCSNMKTSKWLCSFSFLKMSMVLYYWMSKGEHLVCYWVDLLIPAAWWDFYICCLGCLLSNGHSLFPEPGRMSLAGVIKNCVTGDGHNRSLGRMRQCTRAARQGVKQTGAVYYWTESKQNILLLVQCLITECITQDCGSGFSFCNAKDNEKKN